MAAPTPRRTLLARVALAAFALASAPAALAAAASSAAAGSTARRPAAAAVAAAEGSRVARGPNFVILLADDYGHGDPSPPLGAGVGQTPELNAMALAPGAVHFPRSYIGGSVCSPSRASILTGRSCTRDCVISVESMALPLQLQGNTIGDVARAAGYATLLVGKVRYRPNARRAGRADARFAPLPPSFPHSGTSAQ